MPDTSEAISKRLTIVFMTVKGIELGGGIESVTERVGSKLVEKGHRVIVYSASQFGTRPGIHKGMEIRVSPSIMQKHLHKLTLFLTSMLPLVVRHAAASLLRRLGLGGLYASYEFPDVVHIHEFSMFSLFPRLVGIPSVVQMHALLWKRAKWGRVSRVLLKLNDATLALFPSAVTAVSQVMTDHFRNVLKRDVVYIPNGVDEPHPKPPHLIKQMGLNGNDYVLFVARLVPEKGAHYLIEAFLKWNPDLKLVIAGDDPFEKKYIAQLHKMAKGNENILFPGFVGGDLFLELLSNAALFVLPSEIEGMPVALLEAMSYGRCCVVSDIPENIAALGGHGYSFENQSASDLARILEKARQQPGESAILAETGREHVRREYSWDRIASLYEAFYREVIARHKGHAAPSDQVPSGGPHQ